MPERPTPSRKELRKFGLVMTVPFGLLAGWSFWKGGVLFPYLAGVSSFFLLFGLVAPCTLRPVERVWMAFAHRMSIVSTFILLTLAYFLVITPIGLLVRVLGKDLLGLKPRPAGESYWMPVEDEGPGTRHDKPF